MVQQLHKDVKDGTILEKMSTEATAIIATSWLLQ